MKTFNDKLYNVMFLMIAMAISKLFGFGRDIVFSYIYGANQISDVYIIATTIPAIFFGFTYAAINACFIPEYKHIELRKGHNEAITFTNNIIVELIGVCIVISISIVFSHSWILKLFGVEKSGEYYSIAVMFLKICIWQVIFSSVSSVFSCYLQANQKFLISTISGVPLDFALIITYAVSGRYGYEILAIGFVLAYFFQALFLILFSKQYGYSYSLPFYNRHTSNKEFRKMIYPVILGVSINQINNTLDKILATRIVVGGVSAINYAHKLNLLIEGLFITSVVTIIYPTITTKIVQKKEDELRVEIRKALKIINFFLCPVTIGIIILSEPIVYVLFQRGAFDEQATKVTGELFKFYAIGLIAIGIREVFSRLYFAEKETRIPAQNAAFSMVINIVLNFILSYYYGIRGLAIATSISIWIAAILIGIRAAIKFGLLKIIESCIIDLFINMGIALIMGGVTKYLFSKVFININIFLNLLFTIAISVFIYLLGIQIKRILIREL